MKIKPGMLRLYLMAGFLLCPAAVIAQTPVTCDTNNLVPPIIRGEGIAEYLGDLALICTGGRAGESISTTLTLSLSTTLTSKVEGGAPEALLLIDEPAPGSQIVGLNLFQATSASRNQAVFTITFTAPGSAQRILRFVNLRGDASPLGLSPTLMPATINALVAASGESVVINNPQQVVAYLQSGFQDEQWPFALRVRTPADAYSGGLSFPQCTGQNAALVDSPSAPGGAVSFNVKFREGSTAAFKRRNISMDPNAPVAQNVPGSALGLESGFFDPSFSIANGLNTAGLASQGTRLMLRFDNVPAGVALYVTTTPSPLGTSAGIGPNGAQLLQTDANGAGSYAPAAATATVFAGAATLSIAPVTLVNGSGTAVWEVLRSDRDSVDFVSFGIVVAYKSNGPSLGTARMREFFAPVSAVTTNESTIVPRFTASIEPSSNFFAISACGAAMPDLVVSSFSAPPTVSAGSTVSFSSSVMNLGGAQAAPFSSGILLFTDAALTNRAPAFHTTTGGLPSTCSFSSLSASASALCSGTVEVASNLIPGTYYLGHFVDTLGSVAESNESNNSYSFPLIITPCSYSFPGPGQILPPSAIVSSTTLLASGQTCEWTASSDSVWLTINSSGIGSTGITLTAAANPANTRVAVVTIAGVTYKVKQAAAVNSGPLLGPASPASGTGLTQTFTFSASDANGFEDFASLRVVIGTGTVNSCSFTYDRLANVISLLNNAGSASIGSIVPGASGTVGNSQCTLSGVSSSVTGTGNTLSVSVALTFNPTFAGTKTVAVSATDIVNASTGLQSTGSWTVPGMPNPPAVVSGTPISSGVTPQTFTFTGRDADGYADIYRMYFLVNPTPNIPANSCHGFYDRGANALYLYNDTLTALSGPLTPGTAGTLQNSQCVINGSTSSLISASDTDVTINLGLGLQGAYAGTSQKVYLWVKDNENQDTGWVQTGVWNLTVAPNQPPLVVSATPTISARTPELFSFLVRDVDGYADIYRVYFLVNTNPNVPQNGCHGFYDRPTNGLYLYNDALTAISGPIKSGSADILKNSQCSFVGTAFAAVPTSATDLTIDLSFFLLGSYAGTDQKVYLWVKDNLGHDTGWVQTSVWGPSYAVNQPPSVLSGTPTTAGSTPQTFSFTVQDEDSYTDIYRVYFLINGSPTIPQNSCHGFYDRTTNGLYLYNNTLTAISGPLTPNTPGTLQNGQCIVYGNTSSVVAVSRTDLVINLSLGLQGAYAGTTQKVYLWVKDTQNHDTGWVQTSTWNLGPPANLQPSVVSGMPASPISNPQTFTLTGRDPDGFGDIYRMYFLVNPTPNIPANSCHGFYDRAANALYLYNDNLTALSGPLTPGTAGTLQNSQCTVNGSTSSLVSASGTDLTINLGLTVQGSYTGTNQKVYLWVKDSQNHDTGWVQTSTWNLGPIANQAPTVVSGSPSISTVTPQAFTFTGRDQDGYTDIYRMYFLINPTPNIPANSCHGFYDRAANALYLYNDTLTALSGPLTPGTAGTLQNSQCSINGSTSSLISASGTDLTLNLGLVVQGSYIGTSQKVYLWVKDTQNHDTGWVQTGTWTPR